MEGVLDELDGQEMKRRTCSLKCVAHDALQRHPADFQVLTNSASYDRN